MSYPKNIDIHKSAGVLIRNRKFLVVRSYGKSFFVSPGGKLEEGEDAETALVRELEEELNVKVERVNLDFFGTFYAEATGQEHKRIQIDVFLVKHWEGEPVPASEIEEIQWVDSNLPKNFTLGSVFHHHVLPKLKERGLID
jgi:mutator protein MutT